MSIFKKMSEKFFGSGVNETEKIGDNLDNFQLLKGPQAEGDGYNKICMQFPIDELYKSGLDTQAWWMPACGEVFKYKVETPDKDGYKEVALESWAIRRDEEKKMVKFGKLYAIPIPWDPSIIYLNVIAMDPGLVDLREIPTVFETGRKTQPAFSVPEPLVEAFRNVVTEHGANDDVGKRLLFASVLNKQSPDYGHITIDDFMDWSVGMVLDEMEKWRPGDYFDQFTGEEAGLVEKEENTSVISTTFADGNRNEESLNASINSMLLMSPLETPGSPNEKTEKRVELDLGTSPVLSGFKFQPTGIAEEVGKDPKAEEDLATKRTRSGDWTEMGVSKKRRTPAPYRFRKSVQAMVKRNRARREAFPLPGHCSGFAFPAFSCPRGVSGTGPGGWCLSKEDLADISSLSLENNKDVSSESSLFSPRGETSAMGMKLSTSSSELLTPEATMRMIQEDMKKNIDMKSPTQGNVKSEMQADGMIFSPSVWSPILVKPPRESEIITISTSSSSSSSSVRVVSDKGMTEKMDDLEKEILEVLESSDEEEDVFGSV